MTEKQEPVIRIVDDDEMMCSSWVFLLEGEHWKVRAYRDAVEFLENDDFADPGCLLLDVRMPKMSGLELQELMSIREIELPIVFVSGHGKIDMVVHALKHGACDFLEKPVDEVKLLVALNSAVEKDQENRHKALQIKTNADKYALLTVREKEVVQLVAIGLMNKVIADRLGISERTVQIHRGVACRKLGVRSSVDLVKFLQTLEIV
ncbi:MAG: response regulator transcription factor [Duodenibacillus sp.]|nr:response regulator transcription factor [Duodenibacillus sp.]